MIDLLTIFHRGGAVLYTRQLAPIPGQPVDALINNVLLEERAGQNSYRHEEKYTVKWCLDNQLELVFVAVYLNLTNLLYIDDLLQAVKEKFTAMFKDAIKAVEPSIVYSKRFNRALDEVLRKYEGGTSGGGGPTAASLTPAHSMTPAALTHTEKRPQHTHGAKKKAGATKEKGDDDSGDAAQADTAPRGTSSDSATSEDVPGGVNFDKLMAMQQAARTGGKPRLNIKKKAPKPSADGSANGSNKPKGKQARSWDGKVTKEEAEALDYTKVIDGQKAVGESLISGFESREDRSNRYEQMPMQKMTDADEMDDEDEDDEDETEEVSSAASTASTKSSGGGGFFSYFKTLVAGKVLERSDLEPVLAQFKEALNGKNVAADISEKLAESVIRTLEGQKLASFTSVKSMVKKAMEEALTRILTPNRQIDVLHGIVEANEQKRPYSIVFVGVNGVGKSTSLAKTASYFLSKGLTVGVGACDTFRAGAIEQLRTHTKALNIPLYARGYDRDAASVAQDAIGQARRDGLNVVLIDTAGRMQHNEPLMRALAKLITLNKPDLVLFCVPVADHQLLTSRGFKYYHEVLSMYQAGEEVEFASFNSATKTITFVSVPQSSLVHHAPSDATFAGNQDTLYEFGRGVEMAKWSDGDKYGVLPPGHALGGKQSNHLNVQVTGGHQMYVRMSTSAVGATPDFRTAQKQGAPKVLKPVQKVTAAALHAQSLVLNSETGVAPHLFASVDGSTVTCTWCNTSGINNDRNGKLGHGKTCNHSAQCETYNVVQFTCGAAEGFSPELDVSSLSFIKVLGISNDAQLDAFLELYGFWLGDGSLWLNARTTYAAVTFRQRKGCDIARLKVLVAQCLQPADYIIGRDLVVKDDNTKTDVVVSIIKPSWVDYFAASYAMKYKRGAEWLNKHGERLVQWLKACGLSEKEVSQFESLHHFQCGTLPVWSKKFLTFPAGCSAAAPYAVREASLVSGSDSAVSSSSSSAVAVDVEDVVEEPLDLDDVDVGGDDEDDGEARFTSVDVMEEEEEEDSSEAVSSQGVIRWYNIKSAKWVLYWTRRLPGARVRILIRGYHAADGKHEKDKVKNIIFTSSPRVRDELIELCVRAGYEPHFDLMRVAGSVTTVREPARTHQAISNFDYWMVKYPECGRGTGVWVNLKTDVVAKPNQGAVWCVSLPTDTDQLIVVRRAHTDAATGVVTKATKPVIVGNCGEALVGNDAVDQVKEFNRCLSDLSDEKKPRLIDGIILTKFDTIDDKVGAAISMAYVTGQPILFVGTGQTYRDLKRMNVKTLIRALMK